MSQQARQSKYEREKTEFVMSAYYDYRTQLITRKKFLKKVCHHYDREPNCDNARSFSSMWTILMRFYTVFHAFLYTFVVCFYTLLKCVFIIN